MASMALNNPISQTSIVEEVLARVTDSLIKGELQAGDRLPSEMDLCRSLGVGRNSLREAVKMLTALGVLQVKRGDGTFVAQSVSPSMLDPLLYGLILRRGTPYELFELRMLLEVDSVELAAEKATPEDIRRCRETIDRLESAFRGGESDEGVLLDLDLAFHYEVLAASHNALFERIGRTVLRLFMSSIKKALAIDPARTLTNHRKVLAVIEEHQPLKAKETVMESLEKWRSVLAEQGA